MPAALELVQGNATFTNSVITALVAATGQTFTIRNTAPTADIRLLAMWANLQTAAGVFRVRSPRLHDNVQGIRMRSSFNTPNPFFPPHPVQKLYPQDALILEIANADVAGNIEAGFFLAYYSDLPGVAARFIDVPTLNSRGINIVGVEVALNPSIAGGWTGARALNFSFDNLIANTDYAILGASMDVLTGAIGITGPDTGNLRLGLPGNIADPMISQEWFARLTRIAGIPLIPIINSANKAGTTIDTAQNQGGAAVNVTLSLVQLAPLGTTSPTARAPGP